MASNVSPIVSIVMPMYNAAEFVSESIDSLLSQTLESLEIIIVDDGSTDDSRDIISAYSQRDQRIRLLTQNHCHAGVARNLGMDHATGDYIIFLDVDDVFEPVLVERASLALETSDADICLFDARSFSERPWENDYAPPQYLRKSLPNFEPFTPADIGDTLFQIINPAPWTKMYRRSFLHKSGIRFQSLENANDLFFTYAALSDASSIVAIHEALVWYRLREGSSQHSKKRQPLAFLEALYALKSHVSEKENRGDLKKTLMRLCVGNFAYNLRQAWNNNDEASLRLVYEAYSDGAAYDFGLLDDEAKTYFRSLSAWERGNYELMSRIAEIPYSRNLNFARLLNDQRIK